MMCSPLDDRTTAVYYPVSAGYSGFGKRMVTGPAVQTPYVWAILDDELRKMVTSNS